MRTALPPCCAWVLPGQFQRVTFLCRGPMSWSILSGKSFSPGEGQQRAHHNTGHHIRQLSGTRRDRHPRRCRSWRFDGGPRDPRIHPAAGERCSLHYVRLCRCTPSWRGRPLKWTPRDHALGVSRIARSLGAIPMRDRVVRDGNRLIGRGVTA